MNVHLLNCSSSSNAFHGYVTLSDGTPHRIWLQWSTPVDTNKRSFEGVHKGEARRDFKCSPELADLVSDVRDLVIERLESADSPESFLEELQHIVDRVIISNSMSSTPSSVGSTKQFANPKDLIIGLQRVGWENVIEVADDLKYCVLQCIDIRNRKHQIRIEPVTADGVPVIMFDLPCKNDIFQEVISPLQQRQILLEMLFHKLYEKFVSLVNSFQDLWDALEDIDRHCWVIEPEKPSRSCSFRRIVLEKNCTMQIDLNPENCLTEPCSCTFYGSNSVTEALQLKFMERSRSEWNTDRSPRENIEAILMLALPSKQLQKTEDFGLECGICYTFKINDVCLLSFESIELRVLCLGCTKSSL
jgi:E3 ubiquitin-protein ligase FANCL